MWIAVEDHGAGVPVEERELVFERFARGGGRRPAQPSDGAGLGLALVDEHVRLHGGRVWVEDRPDGEPGARFVLELPAEATETTETTETGEATETTGSTDETWPTPNENEFAEWSRRGAGELAAYCSRPALATAGGCGIAPDSTPRDVAPAEREPHRQRGVRRREAGGTSRIYLVAPSEAGDPSLLEIHVA